MERKKNKEKNPTPICIFNLNQSKLDRGGKKKKRKKNSRFKQKLNKQVLYFRF